MTSIDWKNATPEQINLWKLCQGLLAWNTITPLSYQGVFAGSEFSVYNAAKLYLALELNSAHSTVGGPGFCWLYDMANVINFCIESGSSHYDVVGSIAVYQQNTFVLKNVWFSRLSVQTRDLITFNGYRLTIV